MRIVFRQLFSSWSVRVSGSMRRQGWTIGGREEREARRPGKKPNPVDESVEGSPRPLNYSHIRSAQCREGRTYSVNWSITFTSFSLMRNVTRPAALGPAPRPRASSIGFASASRSLTQERSVMTHFDSPRGVSRAPSVANSTRPSRLTSWIARGREAAANV